MPYRRFTEKIPIKSSFDIKSEYFIKRKQIYDILYKEYKKENPHDGISDGWNGLDIIKTSNFINFIRNKLKFINPENYPNIKLNVNDISTFNVDFYPHELARLVDYYTRVVIYEEKLLKILEENKN
jgi:hypothetical protein